MTFINMHAPNRNDKSPREFHVLLLSITLFVILTYIYVLSYVFVINNIHPNIYVQHAIYVIIFATSYYISTLILTKLGAYADRSVPFVKTFVRGLKIAICVILAFYLYLFLFFYIPFKFEF